MTTKERNNMNSEDIMTTYNQYKEQIIEQNTLLVENAKDMLNVIGITEKNTKPDDYKGALKMLLAKTVIGKIHTDPVAAAAVVAGMTLIIYDLSEQQKLTSAEKAFAS